MQTEISDLIVSHYTEVKERAIDRLNKIYQLNEGSTSLDEINQSLFFGIHGIPSKFSTLDLQTEIRSNLLSMNDDEVVNYFHYFIKILHDLESISKGCSKHIDELTEINKGEIYGDVSSIIKYQSPKQLILHAYNLFSETLVSELNVWLVVKKEFGFKVDNWKEIVVRQKEFPNLSDVRSLSFSEKTNLPENEETLPEYEYNTDAQKIAWLYELGILEYLLERCKVDDNFNWRRTANIISSITGMNTDTIRKSLQAIYLPNETNQKNNPLNNPDNKLFVQEMAAKFKLKKNSKSQ
jgi:hypothetical protein